MPHITANGVNLFYDIRGPEAAPVVFFSNSVGALLEMWDAQLAALTGKYRVLRYDARGHGRSQTAAGPTTLPDLAADMLGLLDGLNIHKAHIVGLSLGGMTAQQFAVLYPERLHSLTLMATSSHLQANYDTRAALVRSQGLQPIADAVMGRWFTPGYFQRNPAAIETMKGWFLANDPEGYAQCCEAIHAMDLRSDIASITVPTLILAGIDDPATTVPMMEAIRSRIAGSELVLLPDVAHILNIEQAGRVNRHLAAFLEANSQFGTKPGEGTSFVSGLANRRAVLGAAHVDRSLANAGPFSMPWQDFITRNAWGEIWGDPALPWKTRSMLTLIMMVGLHREEEFKLHLRPALKNGVSLEELRALLLQTAVYAGVPAANAGFRWVKEVLGDEPPV